MFREVAVIVNAPVTNPRLDEGYIKFVMYARTREWVSGDGVYILL